jgi:hypothetical protein
MAGLVRRIALDGQFRWPMQVLSLLTNAASGHRLGTTQESGLGFKMEIPVKVGNCASARSRTLPVRQFGRATD